MDSQTSDNKARRVLIVSNRLPFTVKEEEGKLEFGPSSGGLVTGLRSYLQNTQPDGAGEPNYIWVGWPGISLEEPERQAELRRSAREAFHAYPVFIGAAEMDEFYHGFTNQTIWPLFHYFPSYTSFDDASWQNYRHVNELYCEAVLEVIQPDDLVWIHDYHLMLLPQLIREKMPGTAIGFFLHIPFPAYEIFRLLPREWRTAILNGLLGADLIGFHTYEYSQYFGRAVLRLLGYEINMGGIMVGERTARVETFPMGIDFQKFHEASRDPEAQQQIRLLSEGLADLKVVLSIDRLDYSKGIINRLEGYQVFLNNHPEWRGKVVLALVIVPSRAEVSEYQETKTRVEELVGRINGQFGSLAWTPILYQYRSVPFAELIALYCTSDAALITPLRDGMNLIAKEYVASRADESGVLILSELTGAATELGEALLITPTSRQEIADALLAALEMPAEEQSRRMRLMQERLALYDVVAWARDFLDQLQNAARSEEGSATRQLDEAVLPELLQHFQDTGRRLLFLDYDGTLVPFAPRPEQAAPGNAVRDLLRRLGANHRTEVVVVSGRDKDTLDRWLGELPVAIVAEHGSWIRPRGEPWRTTQVLSDEWKALIRPVLQRYVQRLPGALLEEKSFSLAWHYRQADPALAAVRAKELLDHLVTLTANLDVKVLQGNKVIEVRPSTISKAMVARAWSLGNDCDFILAVGDDWTDEDLFAALPPGAYTVKVGRDHTAARFRLDTYYEVLQLLERLAGGQA